MTRIFKSPYYQGDIESIWSFIAQTSPDAADRVIEGIEETLGVLADFPKIGTPCPHLAPNLRRCQWRDFLIYYRCASSDVEIVRVLHGRRKIEQQQFE